MNKTLKRDLVVFIIIFGLLTLPFLFFNLDIAFEKPFYHPKLGWFKREMPVIKFIYTYSVFLGYIIAVISLFIVSLSYWKHKLVRWRKAAYFMLFVLIMGPGVLVNATFKDHWGRPRPREIAEFNGNKDFKTVWVKGETKGKSFPSGHASIAFYISIPFLFLRKNYKKWAWFFMVAGSLYGLLVGYARMAAGGHFASDVLWACGMVWLVGIVGIHWIKADLPTDLNLPDTALNKNSKLVGILMGIVLPIVTLALLFGTPYITSRSFSKERTYLNNIKMEHFEVRIKDGNVNNISFNHDFAIKNSVNAFGFPNSKLGWNWFEGDTTFFEYQYRGWFTTVKNEVNVIFPINTDWSNKLIVEKGDVYLTIPNDTILKNIDVEIYEGNLMIKVNEESIIDFQSENSGLKKYIDSKSPFTLQVKIHSGKVIVQEQ